MARPSLHDRVFRALLRLFPAEFRGDFGQQMAEDFRDQRDDAAANGRSRRLWISTAADLLQRASREHADVFWRDAVYAVRLLRRRPVSTAAAILSLGIGIGLNSAVFSVVDGVLWRGLPFAHSERLVRLYEVRSQIPNEMSQVMPDDELAWQRSARSFDRLADATFAAVTFLEPGEPQSYGASAVSEGFFDVFGARPILGRLFTPAEYEQPVTRDPDRRTEDARRQRSVMIISHSLWQGRFLGRPDIVGQQVRASGGATLEIVGVMGPEMAALGSAVMTQAWFPGTLASAQGSVTVVGRLAAGVPVATAQAELNVISAAVKSTRQRDQRDGTSLARVEPLLDTIVNPVRNELTFLFGAVLCVLLVACANVVNLFLAHASGRRLELATRVALGATQGHLVRQTLTESLGLTALGGAGGLLLAMWGVPALVALAPPTIPRLNEIAVDWSTVVFTASVSAAVGIFCGLAASLSVNALTPRGVLGRVRTTATPQGGRFRRGLTIVEIGLALMLVIASALMVRSVRALGTIDLGFNPDHVVAAGVPRSPRNEGSATAQRIEARRIETSMIERVKTLPGVLVAGIGTGPLQGGMGIGGLQVPGDSRDFGFIRADAISPGYFEALGARLITGRFFEPRDTADSPTVVILNETAARLFWGDANPLGKSVVINKRERLEVVGVIADVRAGQLDAEPGPAIYQPHVQSRNFFAGSMLIRTDGDPNALVPAIRTIFKAVNREEPFRGVEPLQDRIDRAMAPRRFLLRLIGLFSILTMILAIVGVYGVLAESVTQRIPEIGIRMALGASASNVLALILRQGLWMVAFGIGLGLGGAVLLRGAMRTMVFGVRTLDPSSYVAACLFLLIATLAACAIPARRAARLDPVAALRLE